LPLLTGDPLPTYTGYDSSVDPSIDMFFTNLAFLYGHSSMNSILYRLQEDFSPVEGGHVLLRDVFNDVDAVLDYGIEPYLRGMNSQKEQKVDLDVVEDIRSRFPMQAPFGFDVVAAGVKRNRDVKTCRYNEARKSFNLPVVTNWAELSSDPDVQALFQESYKNIDDVETYFAAFAEQHGVRGNIGALMNASITEQFLRLRDGDPYFYQRPGMFTEQEALELGEMSYGNLIKVFTSI
jgi:peroxidase